MKAVKKTIKKHWIHIWLLMALAASVALISFGAYTGLKSVKRVVTTKAVSTVLFSSNCMMTTTNNKKINTPQFTATVCNYDQNNQDDINPSAITYNLLAEIRVLKGERYLTMSELATALGANSDEYRSYVSTLDDRTYTIQKTGDDAGGSVSAVFNHVFFRNLARRSEILRQVSGYV